MRKALTCLACFAVGVLVGWVGNPRHRPEPHPRHMTLGVPVNWSPEPVHLAVTRIDGPGGVVEFPEAAREGPVWTVRVGRVTYAGVRESP